MTDSRPCFARKDPDSLRDLFKIKQKVSDRTSFKTSLMTPVWCSNILTMLQTEINVLGVQGVSSFHIIKLYIYIYSQSLL